MAGSPKKRARREAERMRLAQAINVQTQPAATSVGIPSIQPEATPRSLPAPTTLKGEVLPPLPKGDDPDFTRTALKRAMRKRAQEYSEKAIAALAAALEGEGVDLKTKLQAANDLLAWGFGKPATEIEAGEGGIAITILRLADQPQEI